MFVSTANQKQDRGTAERALRGVGLLALAATALLPLGGCAAASAADATTRVQPFYREQGMDPPSNGEATVYVDFRDQTVTFDDDEIHEQVVDALEARGWTWAPYDEAQYVLIATVRVFDEGDAEAANKEAQRLGAVAGGLVVAGGAKAAGASDGVAVVSGVASGGIMYGVLGWMLMEHSYYLILDLQLGEKIDGGTIETYSTDSTATLGSVASASHDRGTESAATDDEVKVSIDAIKQQSHLKHRQRIIVTTTGRRLAEEVAREAVLVKLPDAVKSQLPRVHRMS